MYGYFVPGFNVYVQADYFLRQIAFVYIMYVPFDVFTIKMCVLGVWDIH